MSVSIQPPDLTSIGDKVRDDVRLTYDDAMTLYTSSDVHTVGELANLVRERRHGRTAYYNVNRHINYTNYCVLRCTFCSFYRPFGKPAADGYELTVEEIVDRAAEAYEHGATEVHIVGGLHPRLPFDHYPRLCAAIREACPRMHIKAFTAIEIIHFTRIARPRLSIREVLAELRTAGLGSLPGGGAEIFDDRVHDEAFRNKVGEAEWFEVHRTAHELGIFSNATMLYGHLESRGDRVRHLLKLREHQDESLHSRRAHFNCVIPLHFVPAGSDLAHLPGATGLEDLRTLAISRLVCNNIPHVKAFWIMHTPKLAAVSLNWGVDDIDGTVVYYDITKATGSGGTRQELSVDRLQRLIREARCVPVERDTLYRRVIRDQGSWRLAEES